MNKELIKHREINFQNKIDFLMRVDKCLYVHLGRLKLLISLILLLMLSGLQCFSQTSNNNKIEYVNKSGQGLINISFGRTGEIVYNTKEKTYAVFHSGNKLFSNAKILIKNGDLILDSRNYTSCTNKSVPINDQFGKGKKITFFLTKKDEPSICQNFYIYPDREYFIIEVELKGKGLISNYMSPISDANLDISERPSLRSLFVPFDNDAFVGYKSVPFTSGVDNTSSEIGVTYNNESRNGLIIGSLNHKVWKSAVQTSNLENNKVLNAWAGYAEKQVTRDNVKHGSITGNTLTSPKFLVGYYKDWRDGLEEFGFANRISESAYVFKWEDATPVGWNSWGAIKGSITLEKMIGVADYFADSLKVFRSGKTAYIDLDSYWDKLIVGGLEGDYSRLKIFADHCKKKGLEPGIYWAPFVDWGWENSANTRVEGSDYRFSDIWTKVKQGYYDFDGARALDPTHPGTRARIALVIRKFRECGFRFIKIDFLGHAAIEADSFYDKSITTGMQAYQRGMKFLIDQLGNQMFVYAAISPNIATGPYVHSRRIACDAFETMSDTRYTLNSLNYGWWQTNIYPFIDADHVVFGNETIDVNRARLISGLITGTLILGDDYSKAGSWSGKAEILFKDGKLLQLLRDGRAFRPVEGNEETGATNTFVKKIGNQTYLAVFNYSPEKTTVKLNLNRIGLKGTSSYYAEDLFSGLKTLIKKEIIYEFNGSGVFLYQFQIAEQ